MAVGRRRKYPWPTVAASGELWAQDFGEKREAYNATVSAHNYAYRESDLVARTALAEIRKVGAPADSEREDLKSTWRAIVQFAADDNDALFAPRLRKGVGAAVGGILYACPNCGGETAVGVCYTCEPQRWECSVCRTPIVKLAPLDLVRLGLNHLGPSDHKAARALLEETTA